MIVVGPLRIGDDVLPEPAASLVRRGDPDALLAELARDYERYHAAVAARFAEADRQVVAFARRRLPPASVQPYLAACDQRLQALQTEQLLRAAVRRAAGVRGDVLSLVDPGEALGDGGRLLSMLDPSTPG